MKPIQTLTLFLTLFSLTNITTGTEAPALNNILQKHLEAMGGLSNWNQVESIRQSGTIERDGQTVDIVIVKKRPNQIRATVTIQVNNHAPFQVIRAHDGETAWTATRLVGASEMVRKIIEGEAASDLLAESGVLPPLVKMWREGAKIELIGTENFDGQNAFVLEVTQTGLHSTHRFYLSRDSYLPLAHESRTASGTTTSSFYDYKEVQGVYIPIRSKITSSTTGTSIMTMESIEIGVGIYQEYFKAGDPLQTADF